MRQLSIFTLSSLALLLCACSHVPRATHARLREAQDAFHHQDYAKAHTMLTPLAKQGLPDAQYALGYLHYHGLGTTKDKSQAIYWIRVAAHHGSAKALHALNRLYAHNVLPE